MISDLSWKRRRASCAQMRTSPSRLKVSMGLMASHMPLTHRVISRGLQIQWGCMSWVNLSCEQKTGRIQLGAQDTAINTFRIHVQNIGTSHRIQSETSNRIQGKKHMVQARNRNTGRRESCGRKRCNLPNNFCKHQAFNKQGKKTKRARGEWVL